VQMYIEQPWGIACYAHFCRLTYNSYHALSCEINAPLKRQTWLQFISIQWMVYHFIWNFTHSGENFPAWEVGLQKKGAYYEGIVEDVDGMILCHKQMKVTT